MGMKCQTLLQDWYERISVAAATAIPAEFLLFQKTKSVDGVHITNNREAGRLAKGHQMTLLGLEFSYIGTATVEMDYLHKNYFLEVNYDGKLVYEFLPQFFPQTGGSWGVEGANGATTNGVTGAGSLRTMLSGKEFTLTEQVPFEIKFKRTSSVARTTAAGPATGVDLTIRWLVDWVQ